MRRPPLHKALAAALVLALALPLAGCSMSFESASAKALAALDGVESVHAELELSLGASAGILGESADWDVSLGLSMDTVGSRTSGSLSLAGGPGARYIVEDRGGEYDLYISADGGEEWLSFTGLDAEERADVEAAPEVDLGGLLTLYLETASGFSAEIEDTAPTGESCRRYDGFFPGERLAEAFELSGSGAYAGLPEGADFPDVPMSVWFYRDGGLPARVELDVTEAMGAYFDGVFEGLAGVTVGIERLVMSVSLSGYNTAVPATPPAA